MGSSRGSQSISSVEPDGQLDVTLLHQLLVAHGFSSEDLLHSGANGSELFQQLFLGAPPEPARPPPDWSLPRVLQPAPLSNRVQLTLNREILACQGFEELYRLIIANGPSFDAVNVATSFHQLAKQSARQARSAALTPLFDRASSLLQTDQFNAQAIANTLWSLAKIFGSQPTSLPAGLFVGPALSQPTLGLSLVDLLHLLMSRATQHAKQFKAQNVSNSIWAVAKLATSPACAQAIDNCPLLSTAGGVPSLGGSLARRPTQRCDPPLLEPSKSPLASMIAAFSAAPDDLWKTFTAQNVANSLWGLAKLRAPEGALLSHLLRRAVLLVPEMNPQHLSNVAWALGVFHDWEVSGGTLDALGKKGTGNFSELVTQFWPIWDAAVLKSCSGFNSQDVCNTLWALARTRKKLKCVASLMRRGLVVSGEYHGLYAPTCLWAVTFMERYPDSLPLAQALMAALVPRLGTLTPVEALICAYASLEFGFLEYSERLSRKIGDPVLHRYPGLLAMLLRVKGGCPPEIVDGPLEHPGEAADLLLMAENMAQAQVPLPGVLSWLSSMATWRIKAFSPAETVKLLAAFEKLGSSDKSLFEAAGNACLTWPCSDHFVSLVNALYPIRESLDCWTRIEPKFRSEIYYPAVSVLSSRNSENFPVTRLGMRYAIEALQDLGVLAEWIPAELNAQHWTLLNGSEVILSGSDIFSIKDANLIGPSYTVRFSKEPTLAEIQAAVCGGIRVAVAKPKRCWLVSGSGYAPANGLYCESEGDIAFHRQLKQNGWGSCALIRWKGEKEAWSWYISDLGSNFQLADATDWFVSSEKKELVPPFDGWRSLVLSAQAPTVTESERRFAAPNDPGSFSAQSRCSGPCPI